MIFKILFSKKTAFQDRSVLRTHAIRPAFAIQPTGLSQQKDSRALAFPAVLLMRG